MTTKRCFKCERVLETTQFYRHPEMADGLLGKCKACCKRDVRENYARRRSYYLWYDAVRNRTEKRKRAFRERIKKNQSSYKKKWAEKNPHKKRAHTIVKRALASGLLSRKPCSVCGATKNIEAHHEDYTKPLDVVWLCHKHHKEHHFPPPPKSPPIPKASRWDKRRKEKKA